MFLEKYSPNDFSEFIGNKIKINDILKWLKSFPNNEFSNCVISGNHGIGKTTLIKLLEKNLNLDLIEYQQSDLKDYKKDSLETFFPKKTSLDKIFSDKMKKKLMIFNEIESVTIASEKKFLIKLLKKNHKEKIIPIILINNSKHCKIVNEVKKILNKFHLLTPSLIEIKPLVKKICQENNILIEPKYYKGIINFCNSDIRKIILTLEDLKKIFKNKNITKEMLKDFYENNNHKQEEMGLFNSTFNLLNKNLSFEQINTLYQLEKIVLPLTFLENIPLKITSSEKYSKILDSYVQGDLIETSIYTDQNWYLQDLHSFHTCIYSNYMLDKRTDNIIFERDLDFGRDLNKNSLKNINKKNIDEIKSLIDNISYEEIISLSLIITKIINNKKNNLIKKLELSPRVLELLVKINKFEYDSKKMSKKKLSSIA